MSTAGYTPDAGLNLAPRPWALQRIGDWFSDPDHPMMLVRGDPGSGKSSLLLQLADSIQDCNVVAQISRAPGSADPFDDIALLGSIIDGLTDLGIQVDEKVSAPMSTEISVDVKVDEAQTGAQVSGLVMDLSRAGGLLPVAERLIRATPPERHVLVVVDALDQAEDDNADEFLNVVAAIMRAAKGSGVRLACASRRELPVCFDETYAASFDLIADVPAGAGDLRDHLQGQFEDLSVKDRDRVVTAILRGAADNWLWATTNADSLRAEIDNNGVVPPKIQLTKGLDGLYRDGVRRMRQRMGGHWESEGRALLAAVACAFDEHLTVTELRWITNQSQDQIENVARLCKPFLQEADEGIRTFHPDFARWMLAGNVDGVSEELGHLAVARGLTAFGRQMKWGEIAANASFWVVDHWCTMLVLDPFSPSLREYEEELGSILTDPDWAARSNIGFDAVEQAALVAPTLRFPGSPVLPLSTGLRVLNSSTAAQKLVNFAVLEGLSEEKFAEFESIKGDAAMAMRWLDDAVPDYANITLRTLWGAVLEGHFSFNRVDGELQAFLSPSLVLSSINDLKTSSIGLVVSLVHEITSGDLDFLLEGLGEAVEKVPSGSEEWAIRKSLLGHAYRERASRQEEAEARNDDLALALGAYREALVATSADDEQRLVFVIDVANTLRDLEKRSAAELDELIDMQVEVLSLRHLSDDPDWTLSSNLLGHAYHERAVRFKEDDENAHAEDFEKSLSAFRRALEATPAEDDRRLHFAIDVANELMALDHRSDDQIGELIALQSEVLAIRRRIGDPKWAQAANLLGMAHRERAGRSAETGNDEASDEELGRGIAVCREALAATPGDSPDRLNFAVDLADALLGLTHRSDSVLDELIAVQTELTTRRREIEHDEWPLSAALLGRSLMDRSMRRKNDHWGSEEDLKLALTIFRSALAATPPDGDLRLMLSIDHANALLARERRSDSELDELIDVQSHVLAARRKVDHQEWPISAGILASALYERGQRRREKTEGEAAADDDLARAVDNYRDAVAAEAKHEIRLELLDNLANALRQVEDPADEEIEELVGAYKELRASRQGSEHSNAALSSNLFGDALLTRAVRHRDKGDDEAWAKDLNEALSAYREALTQTPPDGERRLVFLIDIANGLRALDCRSDQEIDELITVQGEIRERYWDMGDPIWPQAANLLGDAYRERASRGGDNSRQGAADLGLALAAYRDALAGTPADDPQRSNFAIDLANALFALQHRSNSELVELVEAQSEVVAQRRSSGHEEWPASANLLGRALLERSIRWKEEGLDGNDDLRQGLAAFRDALEATPGESEQHITFVIDVANALRALDRRSVSELNELIAMQSKLLAYRREHDQDTWPISSNLLGDAYRERAEQQDDDAGRSADLGLALKAYRDALDAQPDDDEHRLSFAIDVANTMVLRATVAREGNAQTLDEATDLVVEAAGSGQRIEFTRLLPVLRAALRRHERWSS